MIDFRKPVQLSDGREVRIYTTEADGEWPIHGAVKARQPSGGMWTLVECALTGEIRDSKATLVNVPIKHKQVMYANCYLGACGFPLFHFYVTHFDANQNASSDRVACIPVTLEFFERRRVVSNSLVEVMRVDSATLQIGLTHLLDFHERSGIRIRDIDFEAQFGEARYVVGIRTFYSEPETLRAMCASGKHREYKAMPVFWVSPLVRKGFFPTTIKPPSELKRGLLETLYEPLQLREGDEEQDRYAEMCPFCVSELLCKSVGMWIANKERVSRLK